MKELAIISGSSNLSLSSKISNILGIPLTPVLTSTFGNGECRVEIKENVRNKDVFVVQSASDSPNDHIMELLLLLDTLKRSSCFRTTVVMPCMPYSRQDRKIKSRTPISARLLANILETAGTERFLTADLHNQAEAGFFNIPVDDLQLARTMIDNIKKEHHKNNIIIVSPDLGGAKRAKHYARKLDCGVAVIYKQRSTPGKVDDMFLIGDVMGLHCIIVDDMIDTASTMVKAADLLVSSGALSVECYCTHPVLSGRAIDNIRSSAIGKIYVTDTIDNTSVNFENKISVISAAPLFAEAIKGINAEKSLAYLFSD